MEREIRLYNKSLNAKEKVNMVLSGGLFYRSPVLMKKENDRKIDLRYNNDIDSFDESSSGMKGGKCVMAHQDNENEIEAAGRKLQIRNSTVDFLVFTKDAGEDGIEVRVQNHDVWLTQKAIAQLFDVDRSVVTKHLKNIFESRELLEKSVCAKFAQTADDGKTYQYKFYSLSAIIAVGYRTNSARATQFRQWATKVLDTFAKQGYVLDKERLVNGQIFDEDYFEHLISEIQEIRASERRFYQKITDIYATAVDYSLDSQITRDFLLRFKTKCIKPISSG